MKTYDYDRLLNWSECDPGGIIFFPHYARWMVDGLNAMLLSLGIDPTEVRGENARGGLPVLGLTMKFLNAPALHETVKHRISITKVGSKSISIKHQFFRGEDLLMEAEETRVWAEHPLDNPRALRTKPVPDDVRLLLEHAN